MSKLNVHLPESLHRRAQSLAQDDGVPLDQFIATALAEKVAVLDADTYIRQRAARGNREKFDRVLAKVPDVAPEEQDRLSACNGD
ncbi:MAG: toxin-antitoxin system HicB family antitoxin [Verrucomicrobia bacterium]|nr:toxin-antitoxin system HicB family antitoxin [Verrucomicrobiota bacterium]